MTHLLPVQLGVAFAVAQTDPHPPQLGMLLVVLVSHPLAGLLSQSPYPLLQA
jgi:hypothetical protein